MDKTINIGVMGLSFQAGNKGCEALSYGFMEILNNIAKKKNENLIVSIFSPASNKRLIKYLIFPKSKNSVFPRYKFSNIKFVFALANSGWGKTRMDKDIQKCDVIFDFTAGDSFTDIYGKERFFTRSEIKKRVIDLGTPLVLGNQTFGPFNDDKVKEMAKDIILRSYDVIARDRLSYDYAKELTGRAPYLSTDVAFFLPYTKKEINSDKIKVGINPSGLLWCGGYDGKNQFGLSVDYQDYCKQLIRRLIDTGKYQIYLIPHAAKQTDSTNLETGYGADNDMIACNALHEKFPETIKMNVFNSAIDVKSFISVLDVFTGARMHATIASYSSGVPVIPFSYSRKFEGLYEMLEYPYVISAKKISTDEAVEKTLDYLEHRDLLSNSIQAYKNTQDRILNELQDRVEKIISKEL